MADEKPESTEIKETDIVFDCPFCGKSLAIDYRGAGLVIQCSDCGKHVNVPIPEGMELSDFDSTDEEQEILILHLRKMLAASELKIVQLQSDIEEKEARQRALEKDRKEASQSFKTVMDNMAIIRNHLAEVEKVLVRLDDLSRKESLR